MSEPKKKRMRLPAGATAAEVMALVGSSTPLEDQSPAMDSAIAETDALAKKRVVAEPADAAEPAEPSLKRARSTEEAAASIAAEASTITSGAKALAKGAVAEPRTPTERRPRAADGLVLVHWNVGGLNALLTGKKSDERKALLVNLVAKERPDVLAISEHKLQQKNVDAAAEALRELLPGYALHWAVCTAKNGYSGLVALVRDGLAPTVEIDTVCADLNEGRTITLGFDEVHAVLAYVPNSGSGLKRLDERIETWEPAMRAHLKALGKGGKPVVLLGDLNVCHLDADIWNGPAKTSKNPGCSPRERAAFGELLADGPYVDCFRELHPEATGCFSFWSTMQGNKPLNRGLRLDYAVASAALAAADAPLALHDCAYLDEYAPNGDHAPSLVALKRAAA